MKFSNTSTAHLWTKINSTHLKNFKFSRQEGCPRIHLGGVASGRQIVKDDILRQKFAAQMGVLSYDSEFDAVIESILGNCKDSFICIRGISDYKDGTRQKEWQPYASLAAASVMKAVICSMEAPTNVWKKFEGEKTIFFIKYISVFDLIHHRQRNKDFARLEMDFSANTSKLRLHTSQFLGLQYSRNNVDLNEWRNSCSTK